jgi:hypothetical protein
MFGCRNCEMDRVSEGWIVDKAFVIPSFNEAFDSGSSLFGPVERKRFVEVRSTETDQPKIVNDISTAQDERPLVPERHESLREIVDPPGSAGTAQAELDHGDISVRIHPFQHRPATVVKSAMGVYSYNLVSREKPNTFSQNGIPGCGVLNGIEFFREAVEIIDEVRLRGRGDRRCVCLPVG